MVKIRAIVVIAITILAGRMSANSGIQVIVPGKVQHDVFVCANAGLS